MKRNWGKWAIAALIRAVRTFFQTFAGFLCVGMAMHEVPWLQAVSVSGVAFLFSIVTSLGGLPEVEDEPEKIEPPDENEAEE